MVRMTGETQAMACTEHRTRLSQMSQSPYFPLVHFPAFFLDEDIENLTFERRACIIIDVAYNIVKS